MAPDPRRRSRRKGRGRSPKLNRSIPLPNQPDRRSRHAVEEAREESTTAKDSIAHQPADHVGLHRQSQSQRGFLEVLDASAAIYSVCIASVRLEDQIEIRSAILVVAPAHQLED